MNKTTHIYSDFIETSEWSAVIASTSNTCLDILFKAGAKSDGEALSNTATLGDDTKLDMLIKAGADVNWSGTYVDTPLILAAHRGFIKCVKLLLEAGADVNMTSDIPDRKSGIELCSVL